MGKLVPFFSRAVEKHAADLKPPPSDALEGASWLHEVLKRELWQALQDPTLTDAERRSEVLRFARAIGAATPNHELYQAREMLKDEDQAIADTTLQGRTTKATKGAKPLRGKPRAG